ncbi:MAG: PstS family phosphate ABC transporter substrate-binding protein [Fidelibacterota bacterium]|nr:MAG: PstS family phosphate ABC transporter substrate-binding protein [Candidatus Neomarinimicrobiota bacterium]
MKIIAQLILLASAMLLIQCQSRSDRQVGEGELAGSITLSGAWALYPMAVKWAEEFERLHHHVRIDVAAGGAGKGMADALAGVADIGNVSRDIYPQEIAQGAWWVSVTKDAVVPTVNAGNPHLQQLLRQGMDRETLRSIWITGTTTSWGRVIKQYAPDQIHVYTRSDACGAAKTWAKYLGENQEDLLGVGVYGDPGLAEAVRQDQLGIGYNNINYAYDAQSKAQVAGIRVLPIDLNNNARLDSTEDFYHDRDQIVRAIARGQYPSPPARDLYFVCQGKPEKKLVREFIRWVLTDGQQYVAESGYIQLPSEILKAQLKRMGE